MFNYVPEFKHNQLVAVLDETGRDTGKRARVLAKRYDAHNEWSGSYVVALAQPHQGCPTLPAALLRVEREPGDRPARRRTRN